MKKQMHFTIVPLDWTPDPLYKIPRYFFAESLLGKFRVSSNAQGWFFYIQTRPTPSPTKHYGSSYMAKKAANAFLVKLMREQLKLIRK